LKREKQISSPTVEKFNFQIAKVKKIMKKRYLKTAFLIMLSTFVLSALAQNVNENFPKKTVKLVVGYGPGGSTDLIGRVVAQGLSEVWGTSVVVENKPGGDTIIASDMVAKSAPDGYTLLVANSTNATNAASGRKLPYDQVNDFTSIAMVGAAPNLLSVNPSFPVNNLKELILFAKNNRNQFSYGTVGAGSSQNLLMEYFAKKAGIELNHIPYKSGGAAITDIIGNHLVGILSGVASQEQFVKSGKLKPIVFFSEKRSSILPSVPSISEDGFKGLSSDYWIGIMGPPKMSQELINKINADINTVLKSPDVQETFKKQGVEIISGSPKDMGNYYAKELRFWSMLTRELGIDQSK